jgi:hypothetical protein
MGFRVALLVQVFDLVYEEPEFDEYILWEWCALLVVAGQLKLKFEVSIVCWCLSKRAC